MEETWKDVIDNENYAISSFGKLRNKKTDRILKSWFEKKYDCFMYELTYNRLRRIRRRRKVSRLIAEAFIPNPENKKEVEYIDGDITNNSIENLRWI